jgi:hypothetical protein
VGAWTSCTGVRSSSTGDLGAAPPAIATRRRVASRRRTGRRRAPAAEDTIPAVMPLACIIDCAAEGEADASRRRPCAAIPQRHFAI